MATSTAAKPVHLPAVSPSSALAVPPAGGWFTHALQAAGHAVPPRPAYPIPPANPVTGTLVLQNRSIQAGFYEPINVAMPTGISFDPINQSVYVAGAFSDTVEQLNPTNGSAMSLNWFAPLVQGPQAADSQAADLLEIPTQGMSVLASPYSGSVEFFPLGGDGLPLHVTVLSNGSNVSEPVALAWDSIDSRVLVTDAALDRVWVLDPSTSAILGWMPVGASPDAIAYDAATGFAYVGNYYSANVTVVDPLAESTVADLTIASRPVSLLHVGSGASDMLWVLNQGTGTVTALYSSNNSVWKVINLPSGSAGYATSLVAVPDRNEVLALNSPAGSVTAVNVTTGGVRGSGTVGGVPYRGVYDAVRGQVDVTNVATNSLDVLDAASLAPENAYLLGAAPTATVFDATTDVVYVADASVDYIDEVDARTDQVVGTFALRAPATDLLFAPGPNLMAAIMLDGNVSFFNPGGGAISTWGPGNGTVILHGAYGNGEFFFTGGFPNVAKPFHDVFIIAASGFGLINTLGTGVNNNGIAYDPVNRNCYVAENGSISIVNSVSNSVTGTLLLPALADVSGIVYNNVSNSLVISDSHNGVYAWNFTTSTFTSNSSSFYIPGYPSQVLFVQQMDLIFATDYMSGTLAIMSEFTGSINPAVGGYTFGPYGTGFSGLGYSTLTGTLYVAFTEAGTVTMMVEDTALTPPMVATLVSTSPSVQVNTTVNFTATATFPAWADNFTYTGLPASCPSRNVTVLNCTPTTPGAFSVTVHVRSPAGFTATATVPLAVFAPLAITGFTASPSTFTLGITTRIVVQYVGGVAPVTVSYPTRPTGCGATGSLNWTCTPTAAGNYTVGLELVDAVGHAQFQNLSLTVNGHLLIVSFAPSVNSTSTGTLVNFTAVITGGTAPFTYSYTGLPPGCLAVNLSIVPCVPTTAGVYPVQLKVTDADGVFVSASSSIVVNSKGGSTGASGGLTTTELILIVVLVIVIAAAAILLAARRRGPPPAAPRAPGAPPSPAGAAPPAGAVGPEPVEGAEGEELMFAPPPPEPVLPEAVTPPPRPVRMGEPTEPVKPVYYAGETTTVEAPTAKTLPPAGQRPALVCSYCGTANEPWLSNCRKCKRALMSTGSS